MIPPKFIGAGLPRSPAAIQNAAAAIGCITDVIQAVIDVETSGAGFLPDKRPKILCERHYFSAFTGGRWDLSYPQISSAKPGGYLGGAQEYTRLGIMYGLDPDAALKSTSWGLPQIMGSNFLAAGYAAVDAMVADFCASEDNQIASFAKFIVASGLAGDLQRQDVVDFARGYNGPDYAVNQYDVKIAADLTRLRAAAGADGTVSWPPARQMTAQVQAALNLRGLGPLAVDGWSGPQTMRALRTFQIDQGISPSGTADAATLTTLGIVQPV